MKILFVCSGNTCRSPMAEALFIEEAKKRGLDCECRSAGIVTFTGGPASENTIEVMKEIGIDLTHFRTTSFKALLAEDFDLYVPMTYTHAQALMQQGVNKHKIYMFDKDVPDPYGGGIDFYRQTRDALIANMPKLADFVEKQLC